MHRERDRGGERAFCLCRFEWASVTAYTIQTEQEQRTHTQKQEKKSVSTFSLRLLWQWTETKSIYALKHKLCMFCHWCCCCRAGRWGKRKSRAMAKQKERESEQEKWIKQLYDITRNKGTISIQVGGRSIYNSVESLDKTFSRLFVIANIREMSMLFLIRFRNAFLLLLLLLFFFLFLLYSFGFAASVVGCSDSKKQKKTLALSFNSLKVKLLFQIN